jgi:hypothetical protein
MYQLFHPPYFGAIKNCMGNRDDQKIKSVMLDALLDFWENFLEPNMATKEDLKFLATKDDLNKVATAVKDIKRQLLDLESDTPTRSEFTRLKLRVDTLT